MERQQNYKKAYEAQTSLQQKRTRVVTTNHDQGKYSRKRSSRKRRL